MRRRNSGSVERGAGLDSVGHHFFRDELVDKIRRIGEVRTRRGRRRTGLGQTRMILKLAVKSQAFLDFGANRGGVARTVGILSSRYSRDRSQQQAEAQ